LGKIAKFFNDLKTVAFSGSFTDLSNKPENSNTFQGTIAEWNQLSLSEKKAYDHASIPDSIDGNETFPAARVILSGGGNVEDILNSNLFKVVTYTQSSAGAVTVAANSNERVAIDTFSMPEGYTCIGIWRISCHKSGLVCGGVYFSGNNLYIGIQNVTSNSITGVRPSVGLAYVKSTLVS
jgi:hypothetical protein